MQEYSVLGGKCPGESKKKLGGFCPWWKMSRRIEKKIGRKLSWEENIQEDRKKIRRKLSWKENVQENRKKNQEDFVPGGKCPGRIVKKFGRIIEEENVAGGKCLGGFCNSVLMVW